MKVIAMAEVYLYDLSLRRAMDAARFFSLVGLSLSLLHVTNFFSDVIGWSITNWLGVAYYLSTTELWDLSNFG